MAPPRRTVTRPAAPVSSGFRGAEGRRKMQEEEERANARREASAQMSNMPFRFYCPTGETREYIIVDAEPDFFRYEHNLKNSRSGKWDIYCACVAENANCPVCKIAERPAYFAMYLTIIDLTPYESSSSGEEVPWSKKLLVVKPAQHKKFTRLFERHGTLRGMLMQATRDGEKDAAIGNDQEFIEFVEEDELLTYETEYTDKKDKVHKVIGHEVFDYDELFPMPTEQQLRALVGGAVEPGSRDEDERSTSRAGSRTSRGGDGWDKDEAPARKTVSTRTSRAAPEPEEEPAPRRATVSRRVAAPADEVEEEVEDRAPPPSRTSRTVRGAPAPVRRTQVAEEDDAEPEDPPQRTRVAPTALADKRRALRR